MNLTLNVSPGFLQSFETMFDTLKDVWALLDKFEKQIILKGGLIGPLNLFTASEKNITLHGLSCIF